MTKLQRAFSRSGIIRKELDSILTAEGLPGSHPELYDVYAQIFERLPEPHIKLLLYTYLREADTLQERTEAARLLSLAETALTTLQRQELTRELETI